MPTTAINKAKQQLEEANSPTERMFYTVLIDVLNHKAFNLQDALKVTRSICEARLCSSGEEIQP